MENILVILYDLPREKTHSQDSPLCRGGAGPKGKAGPARRLHDGGAAGAAGRVHRREKRGRGHAGL